MNYKTITFLAGAFILAFLGLESIFTIYLSIGILLVIIPFIKKYLEMSVTDSLVWEERQRQRRLRGKSLLDETKQALWKAKLFLIVGKRDKAIQVVDRMDKEVKEYLGPLDSSQNDEHKLINEFRISNGLNE